MKKLFFLISMFMIATSSIFLVGLGIYILNKSELHIGVDIKNITPLFIFFVVFAIFLIKKMKKIAIILLILSTLSIGFIYLINSSKIIIPYEEWIKKGMPE